MRRFVVYLARFALMILGFAVSALAASAFLHLIWFGPLDPPPEEVSGPVMDSLLLSIPFMAMVVAYFAFLPATVVLVLAELLGRRDWLFYALGGGAASLFFLARHAPGMASLAGDWPGAFLSAAAIGAGMVGGIGYWLVAGRSAGLWREAA